MLDSLRLYTRYIGISIRGQMQYRASFILQSVGEFWTNIAEFLAIWALFHRFGSLGGWSLAEVALLYGLVHTEWAITDALSHGFDAFGETVKAGEFDRVLLRPRTTVLQLAGQEFTMRRVGRLTQGLVILGGALVTLPIAWTPAKVFLLLFAVFGGAALFYGLLILQATFCFWTVESLEIMNIFTYGGMETARYPMSIYRPIFRRFFTAVVPLACVTYFPALALLNRSDPLGSTPVFQWCAPVLGLLFFMMSLGVWRFGVRHYQSTGS